MIKNYIFDLDGTIVNSSMEVLACFKKAFKKADYEIDESRLTHNVIGPPLKQILKLIAPNLDDEKKLEEIVKHFRDIYDNNENDISIMYEGMYDYLKSLKDEGCKVFMATFKPMIPTMRIVKMLNIEEFFDDIYTIDKFNSRITKEEMIKDILYIWGLKPEETVMIGDAPTDMTAAKANNVKAAGVHGGYGSDKEPLKQTADVVVNDVEELRACLKA
ncbi:HAD hydrolase-like protein [bacterium]|nr:HAD hydrolase-like protein [bacterium]